MIFMWPRCVPMLVVLALAAFAIVSIRSLWEPVLRAAGWALVVNEPVMSADIIVLSVSPVRTQARTRFAGERIGELRCIQR